MMNETVTTQSSRLAETADAPRTRRSRPLLAIMIANLVLTLLLAIIVAIEAGAAATNQERLAKQLDRLTMIADRQAAMAKTNQETAWAARLADTKAILDAIAASRPAPAAPSPPLPAALPSAALSPPTLPPIPQIVIPDRPAPRSPR